MVTRVCHEILYNFRLRLGFGYRYMSAYHNGQVYTNYKDSPFLVDFRERPLGVEISILWSFRGMVKCFKLFKIKQVSSNYSMLIKWSLKIRKWPWEDYGMVRDSHKMAKFSLKIVINVQHRDKPPWNGCKMVQNSMKQDKTVNLGSQIGVNATKCHKRVTKWV